MLAWLDYKNIVGSYHPARALQIFANSATITATFKYGRRYNKSAGLVDVDTVSLTVDLIINVGPGIYRSHTQER